MSNEYRWLQRLQNLNKAFQRLEAACAQDTYNDLERAGLVQTYAFTFELAWKTLKDKLNYEGYEVQSPREVIKQAFASDLIEDVDTWLSALEIRNLFIHTYQEEIALQALALIKESYYPMLGNSVRLLNHFAQSA